MSVKGLKEVTERLLKLGKEGERLIKDEVEAAGRDIEFKAKQRAPVNLGTLRRSINYESTNNGYGASISVNVPYAAYQEFGTGGLVNVPSEMREWAEYYKGKGVRQVNIRPQPFLYPSFVEARKEFIENLRKGLVRLTR